MHLLFDLDGTLTDSREGVLRCLLHGLAEVGVAAPPIEELTQFIGPPLPACYAALLGKSHLRHMESAIAAYRRRFEEVGMFENALYPGIKEALEGFEAFGHRLCVVTAKPRRYAWQILEHFKLAQLFCGVYGPELSQREYSKESLIRDACSHHNVIRSQTVMIGDRADDILGAKSNGLHSIGVTWGYGEREELAAAQPDRLVTSAGELVDYLNTTL